MPIVRVEPAGIELVSESGESLMAAANRLGYWWPTLCGGEAECTVCCTQVLAGAHNLTPPQADEQLKLAEVRRPEPGAELRLACQAVPVGDVVVLKKGVKPQADR